MPRAVFRKPAWRAALLGLLCALAAWLGTRPAPVRGLEEWTLDGRFHSRGSRPTTARVVIIGLDDASLNELHKPYAYLSPELAEVVTFVKGEGASAIGLDVLIPESDSFLPELQQPEPGAPPTPGDATKLGAAIRTAGNVVLPQLRVSDDPDDAK